MLEITPTQMEMLQRPRLFAIYELDIDRQIIAVSTPLKTSSLTVHFPRVNALG
jgi:hypothetical protein